MPKSEYNTRQRELIINFLRTHQSDHIRAADIMTHLSVGGSPVGIATVYRTLDRLSKSGMIRRYLDESGSACYQYIAGDTNEHFHLKCTSCGKLIHLECSCFDTVASHIRDEHNFIVDPRQSLLYGRCVECEAKLKAAEAEETPEADKAE